MARVLDYLEEDDYNAWKESERKRKEREAQEAVRTPSEPTPWQQAFGAAGAQIGTPQPMPQVAPEPAQEEPTPWQRAWQQAPDLLSQAGKAGLQFSQGAQQTAGDLAGRAVRAPFDIAEAEYKATVEPAWKWYQENLVNPTAELQSGAMYRGEVPEALMSPEMGSFYGGMRFGQDQQQGADLSEAWKKAGERWANTPETAGFSKGLAEMVVPTETILNLAPFEKVPGLVRQGAKLAGEALPEVGQVARKLATEEMGAVRLPGGDDIAKGKQTRTAKVKPLQTPEATTTQPWEMTKEAYVSGQLKGKKPSLLAESIAATKHRVEVENTLAQGKPVPSEVLAEYPDLAAKYGKQAAPLAPEPPVQAISEPSVRPSPATPIAKTSVEAEEDYRIPHRPNSEGPRAFDLTETDIVDKDIYEHPDWFVGDPGTRASRESITALRRIRGNPDAMVTIFRSAPAGKEIQPGDWVSLSKQYAKEEGRHPTDPKFDMPVVSKRVRAADVRFAGDDLNEFGYFPESKVEPPTVKPPLPTSQTPSPNSVATDAVETPTIAATTEVTAKLPRDLAGAKPRYKSQTITFESDVDKALYVIGNEGTRSKRHDDYLAFLQSALPDRSDRELLVMAQIVRQTVKKQAEKLGTESVAISHARVTKGLESTQGAIKPAETASTAPSAPVNPNRKPLWENDPAAGLPPVPPEPPTGTPALPSGRQPGGPQNMRPSEPIDDHGRLLEAVTPEKIAPRDAVTQAKDWMLREFYDRVAGLKPLEEATSIPVYKLARLVPGFGAKGEDLVRRLINPVLNRVEDVIPQLEQYMTVMHMEDLAARNPEIILPANVGGAGFTRWGGILAAKDKVLARLSPEARQRVITAADTLWQRNRELILTPLRDDGLLSKEAFRDITTANPHYVDFHREKFSMVDDIEKRMNNPEASVSGNLIERINMVGSDAKLDRPLARTEAQIIRTQELVARNRAAKAIVLALDELQKKTGQELVTILKPGQKAERSKDWDIISFMVDGEVQRAQVPRSYALAAKGLEAEPSNWFVEVLRKAASPLMKGAVTYDPAYAIFNTFRDSWQAFLKEGLVPLSPEWTRGWIAAWHRNADFSEVAEAGGLMSGLIDSLRSNDAMKQAAQLGAITVQNPYDLVALPFRLVRRFGEVSEQATRVATYHKVKVEGLGQLEDAFRTRNVTLDFRKGGHIARLLNQVIPFLNAGVQGSANLAKLAREDPKGLLLRASPFAMVSGLAFLNNQRFETADKIPDYERYNYFTFIVGEGDKAPDPKYPNKPAEKFPVYLRLPKGQWVAALTAPVELTLKLAWSHDDRSIVDQVLSAAGFAAQAASPVDPSVSGMLPPALSTIYGLESGQDLYRHQPIVPRREQDRPPELQFDESTSKLATLLGEKFHISPRMLDWAINDYTAGTGKTINWLLSLGLEAAGYDPIVYGEAKKQPLTPVQEAAKAPVVSRLLGTRDTAQENTAWEQFNQTRTEAGQRAAEMPELRRLGITIGPVGESISIKPGVPLQLTPEERAELQRQTTERISSAVRAIVDGSAKYKDMPDHQKAEALRRVIEKEREKVRDDYLKNLSESEKRRRAFESAPVPLTR